MQSFNLNMNRTNNMLGVEMFILTQTGTYQEQYLRPFEVHVNQDTISRLQYATQEGANLGVASVQNVASDIVCPRAQVEGKVGISGEGWKSRRFRFIMKVREQNPFMGGVTTQRIFFGSSDNCDISYGGLLDPKMRIYFNSETIINESIQQTINGPVRNMVIAGSNQIVSPVDIGSSMNQMFAPPTAHLIRPEDIFSIGQTLEVAKRVTEAGLIDGVIDRHITQSAMLGEGGAYKYSHRRDTAPTRFVSDTLGAYSHAVKEANMANEGDYLSAGSALNPEMLLGEAHARVANQEIQKNSFLAMLKDHANYMERGYVELQDLVRLFPEVGTDQVTKFSMDNGQSKRIVNFAEHSNHMHGSDPASIAASLLGQVIPSLMMDTFLRHVKFAVMNGTGPNNYTFQFFGDGTKSLIDSGFDMRPHLMEFERRMATDCLNSISRGNQMPFQISMSCDLAGDSVIDIQLAGDNSPIRYVVPTFTDSLFSPVITRNAQLPQLISNDLLYLVGEVIPTNKQQNVFNSFDAPYVHPVAAPIQINGAQDAIQFADYL
jgi:hypothetical protein